MQKMEKILEEIEQAKREPWYRLNNQGVKSRIDGAIERVIEIVRKHMSGKGMNVHANDGWVLVEERLPEVDEDVEEIIEDDDCPEYNVTIRGASESTTLKYSPSGSWFDSNGYVYDVIAWQPLPEPYKPKQPETCKYTGGSCCWPIDQCKK